MLVSPVDEPLINLVAEAESVMFNAEIGNQLQLISGENLQSEDRNDCDIKSAVPFFPYVQKTHTKTGETKLAVYSPFQWDYWGC